MHDHLYRERRTFNARSVNFGKTFWISILLEDSSNHAQLIRQLRCFTRIILHLDCCEFGEVPRLLLLTTQREHPTIHLSEAALANQL